MRGLCKSRGECRKGMPQGNAKGRKARVSGRLGGFGARLATRDADADRQSRMRARFCQASVDSWRRPAVWHPPRGWGGCMDQGGDRLTRAALDGGRTRSPSRARDYLWPRGRATTMRRRPWGPCLDVGAQWRIRRKDGPDSARRAVAPRFIPSGLLGVRSASRGHRIRRVHTELRREAIRFPCPWGGGCMSVSTDHGRPRCAR